MFADDTYCLDTDILIILFTGLTWNLLTKMLYDSTPTKWPQSLEKPNK
jgi:hypothetical protein